MRIALITLVLAAGIVGVLAAAHKTDLIDASNIDSMFAEMRAHTEWQSWKATHGRRYASPAIEAHRFAIFRDNLATAAELQRKDPSATYGVTKFSDLHPVEFRQQYLNFRPAVGDAAVLREAAPVLNNTRCVGDLPVSFDWRKPDGNRPVGVTAVKDQGRCGSCWAFSATEELESVWILAGNPAVELSTEQTVDCDTRDGGCNGGDTVTAFEYMKSAGVESEKAYPYHAGTSGTGGSCKYDRSAVVAKMTGYNYATPACFGACSTQDEGLLKKNLYNIAPVSICVDASSWQFYTSGILTASSGCRSSYNALNHCVQLVGYGSVSGQEFWSARNSWATGWGEQGYIRLSYGANTCGLADEATIVTV